MSEAGDAFGDPVWRVASRGRCHVYVLPCREADVLKIGHARDPLQRLRALHRRWFEFFDLERGLSIETERVADARRIERELQKRAIEHAEPAPLSTRAAAGGRTEWFRGAHPLTRDAALAIAASGGHALHEPLGAWVRQRLLAWDGWFDWSLAALQRIEYLRHHGDARTLALHERSLRDALDAAVTVNADPGNQLPSAVRDWYESGVR